MLSHRLKTSASFWGGLAALSLASIKHKTLGYIKPTGFSGSDLKQSIEHVTSIAEDYHNYAEIDGRRFVFEGANVLELGPGATLGAGVLLAGLGIQSYRAIDAFPLARLAPKEFYLALADAEKSLPANFDEKLIASAARSVAEGRDDLISYAFDPAFNARDLAGEKKFDLIVSNAAFEHFDDIDRTIREVSSRAAPGAFFIVGIDFQTHTRVIRERDPNNIYRFPAPLYQALHFPGQPNRRRPKDYVNALVREGWTNVVVRPVSVASPSYSNLTRGGLDFEFRDDDCDMHILTCFVAAERQR